MQTNSVRIPDDLSARAGSRAEEGVDEADRGSNGAYLAEDGGLLLLRWSCVADGACEDVVFVDGDCSLEIRAGNFVEGALGDRLRVFRLSVICLLQPGGGQPPGRPGPLVEAVCQLVQGQL